MLRFSPTTTYPEQANCTNDWCKFRCSWVRGPIWWRSKSEIHVTQKIVCSGGIWLKNLHPSTDEDVSLCQGISRNLFCIQRNRTYFLGCTETGHYPYRQQSCYAIFSNENNTPSPVECVWLCDSVHFCHCAHPRSTKYSCRIFVPVGSKPEGQIRHEDPRRRANATNWNKRPISRGVTGRTNLLH